MKPLCDTVRSLPGSGIRRFFDLVSEMEDVISLGVGEPDFVTPRQVRERAREALACEAPRYTSYTSNYGLLELRQEIVRMHERRHGVTWNPKTEVLVTIGVSEALDTAFRAILNPGDEVLIPEPCYVSYIPCVAFAGGVAVTVPTTAGNGFQVEASDLEKRITPRTKAILLAYPTNPTGGVLSRERAQAVVDLAIKHDLYIVSDEIYERLSYETPATCVASLPGAWERTISLNGFSKAYAMTGWRVGYACAPSAILENMMKIHQYTMLCASHLSQLAAIEALCTAEDDVAFMVDDYNRRRRLFVDGLNQLGLDCPMPGGAFYAFPSIAKTGLSDEVFTERLLHEARVLVVPGSTFGASGNGHVRACYATATEKLEEALMRIESFLRKL